MVLPINARKVLATLLTFETVIITVYIASYLLGNPSYAVKALFDLDGEACIPAWFSAMQLFVIGTLLILASLIKKRKNISPKFLKWAGIGFLFISADEAAMIHERMQGLVHYVNSIPQINGHGVWIFFYLSFGLFLLAVSRRALFSLWQSYRREMSLGLAGFSIFIFGAVGLEILSYLFLRSGATPFMYVLEVAMEEYCEMSGVSLMLFGVFQFLHRSLQEARPANVLADAVVPVAMPVRGSVAAVTEGNLPVAEWDPIQAVIAGENTDASCTRFPPRAAM